MVVDPGKDERPLKDINVAYTKTFDFYDNDVEVEFDVIEKIDGLGRRTLRLMEYVDILSGGTEALLKKYMGDIAERHAQAIKKAGGSRRVAEAEKERIYRKERRKRKQNVQVERRKNWWFGYKGDKNTE